MPTLGNAVVYLLGPYGVGKLTIAKELCAETAAILVDNHLINNPILSVIGADGVTPLPAQTWDLLVVCAKHRFKQSKSLERPAPPMS